MGLWRLLALPGLQIGTLVAEGWAAWRGASPYVHVPPLEPSLRLVGEAVLDRSFTLWMNALMGVPHPSEVRRAQADALAMRDFLAERGWLRDPRGFHRDPQPVHEWAVSPERAWTGPRPLRYAHLRMRSGYEPEAGTPGRRRWLAREANRTLHAYVLQHEGGPRPWLVCVHGFAMGGPLVTLRGFGARRLHEELGLNLVLPCLPLHGPRGSGRVSGSELLSPDTLQMIHLFAQSAWDLRRIVGWVRARGAPRVGLYGLSLGGYASALTAGLEELDCVIAGIPAVEFTNLARDNEPWVLRRYDDAPIDWQVVREASHPVSPLSFAPKVPREGRFVFAGIGDRVARPDQARALWRHWERPEIHWFSGGHVGHQWNRSIRGFVESALRRALLGESGE
jgi:hypothetical protein